MILTVELAGDAAVSNAEVAICFDDDGLEFLVQKLSRLRGKRDHDHLMTATWAGQELTEEKQGDAAYVLVNHLRLVKF